MKRRTKETEPESGSEIMTIHGVAEYLNCHYGTIYRLLSKRAIPAFRLGSDWRFMRSDIDNWIENKTIGVSGTELETHLVRQGKPKLKPAPHRAKKPRV